VARAERGVVVALGLTIVLSLALVGATEPGLVRFWPFGVGELAQLIAPLFLVALFVERIIEVFLATWRQRGDGPTDKARTRRIAFAAGTTIGVVIAALGVRVLELLADPTVFAVLPELQRRLFHVVDVLFTGAILGGGADGVHKLVTLLAAFVDTTARQARARGEAG
jgi:hypothetical protein